MLHKVILLHGVNNFAGDALWTDKLESMWESSRVSFRVNSWTYGGLMLNRSSAALTWLPWYRRRIRTKTLEALARVEHLAAGFSHTVGHLSVIGHSFAGHIVQAGLESGWHWHRIVLIASAMDENFNWWKYDKQFGEAHIYWSPCDEVIPWSSYGKQGVRGPQIEHPRVFSYREENIKHNDWVTDDELILRARIWRRHLEHP